MKLPNVEYILYSSTRMIGDKDGRPFVYSDYSHNSLINTMKEYGRLLLDCVSEEVSHSVDRDKIIKIKDEL